MERGNLIVILYLSLQVLGDYRTVYKYWGNLKKIRSDGVEISNVFMNNSFIDSKYSNYYRYLEVVNSSITIITPNTFQYSYRLLYLSDINISTILPRAFQSSKSTLIELNLSKNNILQIDSDVFKDLYILKYLNLSFNNIKTISQESFMDLKELEVIYLHNNKISSLADVLFNSQKKSLKVINASSNYLTEINKAFSGMESLVQLHLQYNHISKILPNSFQDLNSLEYLDISHNHLNKFRYGVFDHLDNLQYFNFSYNNFIQFPVKISTAFKKVKVLNIDDTILLDIQPILKYFPSLQRIDIERFTNSCKHLMKISNLLQDQQIIIIYIKRGDSSHDTRDNIRGIPCYDEDMSSENGEKRNLSKHDAIKYNSHKQLTTVSSEGTSNYNSKPLTDTKMNYHYISMTISIIIIILLTNTILIAIFIYFLIKLNKVKTTQPTLLELNENMYSN